ncbi:AtpZ/AtpI family protein [Flavobacterium agricola]|uniref:AtpZ/AtpI family protein n=1 Tax=Flavobacterium agricola TaxID=2870839 RepID=A0ABY6M0F3_9FLAO|nr:AtpZ/AtpI family protein [Flavobacterium agricola]UYW00895.1 AtpZ/AtpI family protein [Flavobacterium agricola]
MKKNNNTKWLVFVGIPAQMGLTIYLFYQFGVWLDANYASNTINYEKALTLLGVFLAIYVVIKQVQEVSNKND